MKNLMLTVLIFGAIGVQLGAAHADTRALCNLSRAASDQLAQDARQWLLSNVVGSFTGAPRAKFGVAVWPGSPIGCLYPGACPGPNNPLSCYAMAVSEYAEHNGAIHRSPSFEIEFLVGLKQDGTLQLTLDSHAMSFGPATSNTVFLMREEEDAESGVRAFPVPRYVKGEGN